MHKQSTTLQIYKEKLLAPKTKLNPKLPEAAV